MDWHSATTESKNAHPSQPCSLLAPKSQARRAGLSCSCNTAESQGDASRQPASPQAPFTSPNKPWAACRPHACLLGRICRRREALLGHHQVQQVLNTWKWPWKREGGAQTSWWGAGEAEQWFLPMLMSLRGFRWRVSQLGQDQAGWYLPVEVRVSSWWWGLHRILCPCRLRCVQSLAAACRSRAKQPRGGPSPAKGRQGNGEGWAMPRSSDRNDISLSLRKTISKVGKQISLMSYLHRRMKHNNVSSET